MLAIVIPFYKLTFFEATLQSLANQTDKRFKIYIGDDASPEDCSVLLEKYKGKLDFLYKRFESNLGGISLVKQWERCVEMTNDEEWLMIFGDDDIMSENAVESFYYFIKNNDNNVSVNLVRFQLKVIDQNNEVIVPITKHPTYETSGDLLTRMLKSETMTTTSEYIFKKKTYRLNNGFVEFPLAWFSDYATWLLFGKDGIYTISKGFVSWRLSKLNISATNNVNEVKKLKIKSLYLFIRFIEKDFNIKKRLIYRYIKKHINNLSNNNLNDTKFIIINIKNNYFFNSYFLFLLFDLGIKKIKTTIK